jgi:hypothetical protein
MRKRPRRSLPFLCRLDWNLGRCRGRGKKGIVERASVLVLERKSNTVVRSISHDHVVLYAVVSVSVTQRSYLTKSRQYHHPSHILCLSNNVVCCTLR